MLVFLLNFNYLTALGCVFATWLGMQLFYFLIGHVFTIFIVTMWGFNPFTSTFPAIVLLLLFGLLWIGCSFAYFAHVGLQDKTYKKALFDGVFLGVFSAGYFAIIDYVWGRSTGWYDGIVYTNLDSEFGLFWGLLIPAIIISTSVSFYLQYRRS